MVELPVICTAQMLSTALRITTLVMLPPIMFPEEVSMGFVVPDLVTLLSSSGARFDPHQPTQRLSQRGTSPEKLS